MGIETSLLQIAQTATVPLLVIVIVLGQRAMGTLNEIDKRLVRVETKLEDKEK